MKQTGRITIYMNKIGFENKIALLFVFIGGFWFVLSNKLFYFLVDDGLLLIKLRVYSGWFYVIIFAIIFYIILKRHLVKLRETNQKLNNNYLAALVKNPFVVA